MTEEQLKELELLKKDIDYFRNMDFVNISKKFNRDLTLIESLLKIIDDLKSKEN